MRATPRAGWMAQRTMRSRSDMRPPVFIAFSREGNRRAWDRSGRARKIPAEALVRRVADLSATRRRERIQAFKGPVRALLPTIPAASGALAGSHHRIASPGGALGGSRDLLRRCADRAAGRA